MTNRRLVGHVAIESGHVAIADPIDDRHIKDVFDKMIETNDQTISLDGLVISSTGLGDGFYPVFVETAVLDEHFGGERVAKIIIDCTLTDPQQAFLERKDADTPTQN